MIITRRFFVFNTFQDNNNSNNNSDILNLEYAIKCSYNSYNPDLKEQGKYFLIRSLKK